MTIGKKPYHATKWIRAAGLTASHWSQPVGALQHNRRALDCYTARSLPVQVLRKLEAISIRSFEWKYTAFIESFVGCKLRLPTNHNVVG